MPPRRVQVPLEILYRHERPGLVRLALLITGSPEMAEDAFHDAISRIEGRLAGLERPGAYLRTMVVNQARALARASNRQTLETSVVLSGLDTRRVEIWSALAGLSERRRTALVLRYFGDLSVGEIAEVLHCRPGTVSSLLHRGLADLRGELGRD